MHHFIFYPVSFLLLAVCARQLLVLGTDRWLWLALTALVILLIWLSFMMRQHYALTCQDRIVRLELRLRYFQLTGQRLEPVEKKLSFRQLAALRFASDEELPLLLQRALTENLSPDAIKRAVQQWEADEMRV